MLFYVELTINPNQKDSSKRDLYVDVFLYFSKRSGINCGVLEWEGYLKCTFEDTILVFWGEEEVVLMYKLMSIRKINLHESKKN